VTTRDLHAYHSPAVRGPEAGYSITFATVRPASRGSVRLAGASIETRPLVDPSYLGGERDVHRMLAGLHLARAIGNSPRLSKRRKAESLPGQAAQDDASLIEYLRRSTTPFWHPVGTCRMGNHVAGTLLAGTGWAAFGSVALSFMTAVTRRDRSSASTWATVWPWMVIPCMASPGASTEPADTYCSPGLAARPKSMAALPWKLAGMVTPTGQVSPPLGEAQPFAVIARCGPAAWPPAMTRTTAAAAAAAASGGPGPPGPRAGAGRYARGLGCQTTKSPRARRTVCAPSWLTALAELGPRPGNVGFYRGRVVDAGEVEPVKRAGL
jgi:GMC oxidoreductase